MKRRSFLALTAGLAVGGCSPCPDKLSIRVVNQNPPMKTHQLTKWQLEAIKETRRHLDEYHKCLNEVPGQEIASAWPRGLGKPEYDELSPLLGRSS